MVDATNRRGRRVRCRVTCSPLVGSDKSIRGVIVVVEPQPEGQPAAESG
jgi:two-component system CheB/CheR fusion protein